MQIDYLLYSLQYCLRHMAYPETTKYFRDNYYDNIGQLCKIPDIEDRTWYDWMIKEGKNLNDSDLSKILPSGDIREIRPKNPYLFKVYLQSQVELMTEGKRSVRIMTEKSRKTEDEEYKKKMQELTSIFNKSLNRFFKDKKDEKLVHGNGLLPEEAYYVLKLSHLELLFNASESENDRDLLKSISANCIRILIRESREKSNKSNLIDEDSLIESSSDITKKEICLIEQNFYTALSEFIEKRLKIGFGKLKLPISEPQGSLSKSVLEMSDESKRERSFKRVSRILSLLITSILYSDDLIIRKSGSFDDFLLHRPIDTEITRLNKKQTGQYKNMIYFSNRLKKMIGAFEGGEHPIFRVLRSHTHRYMYCCPENHSVDSPGGYINRKSSVGFTVSNEKRISKISGKKRFTYNEETLKSLNILQKTQWEVNIDLLSFITEGIEVITEGVEDKKINLNVKEFFKQSFYYPTGQNICGNTDCKEFNSEIICPDCIRLRDINNLENIERDKRFTWIIRILNHNANVFWHSWAFDWRGRLIARAPVLSPQKSDIDRALIRFKEWKELGETGWNWFRIFLFDLLTDILTDISDINLFTIIPKKITNESKISWIELNEDNLISLVNNLHENKLYQKYLQLNLSPRPKSQTFQRISALLEFKRLIEKSREENIDVKNLKSGHPVHFDASSNGYQHLSMLTNNVELAKKVNVFSDNSSGESSKKDLYKEVSDNAKENWKKDKSKLKEYLLGLNQLNESQLEDICDLVFSRSMSKLPTMTHIYGARDYELNFIGKNGKGKPDYIRNENKYQLPKYFICWHNESPIHKALKEFDEKYNGILLGPDDGIFSRKKFATKEEILSYEKSNSTLKQSIFIHCLISDYKTSIKQITGNSFKQLKESLKLVIKKLDENKPMSRLMSGDILSTEDFFASNKNPSTISWILDDKSKVENYYPSKKITTQLDTISTLFLLKSPILTNLNPSRFSLLNYFNENISKVINDSFVEEALREYSNRKSKEKDDEMINELKKKLYDSDNKITHMPWKIYSYRIDMINLLEVKHLRLKEIGNKSKGDLASAFSRKSRAQKKNKKNKIKLEEKKIKELYKEREKIKKDKKKLISDINKKPDKIQIEKLFQEKEEERHHYWESISSFVKLKKIESPQGSQIPVDFFRAIMEYLFDRINSGKLEINTSKETLDDWKRACNLTITCNFIDYLNDLDSNKVNSSIAPNFIHSLDAYHMRSSIVNFRKEFEESYHPSIWAVHDSFGTHACYIEKYMQIIKKSFLEMHQDKDLLEWCIQMSRDADLKEKSIEELEKELEEISENIPSFRDFREEFRKMKDVKKLLYDDIGKISKMSDHFLS